MAHYDSLGNRYDELPSRKPVPKPKPTKASPSGRRGRNKKKCEKYRALIGKPNGPGVSGNKSGANKR